MYGLCHVGPKTRLCDCCAALVQCLENDGVLFLRDLYAIFGCITRDLHVRASRHVSLAPCRYVEESTHICTWLTEGNSCSSKLRSLWSASATATKEEMNLQQDLRQGLQIIGRMSSSNSSDPLQLQTMHQTAEYTSVVQGASTTYFPDAVPRVTLYRKKFSPNVCLRTASSKKYKEDVVCVSVKINSRRIVSKRHGLYLPTA